MFLIFAIRSVPFNTNFKITCNYFRSQSAPDNTEDPTSDPDKANSVLEAAYVWSSSRRAGGPPGDATAAAAGGAHGGLGQAWAALHTRVEDQVGLFVSLLAPNHSTLQVSFVYVFLTTYNRQEL